MKKIAVVFIVILIVGTSLFLFKNESANEQLSDADTVEYKSELGVTFKYPRTIEISDPCAKSMEKVNLVISEGPKDIFYHPEYYYDYDGSNCKRKVPSAISGELQVRTIIVRDAQNEKDVTNIINQNFDTTCVSSVKLEDIGDGDNKKVTIERTELNDEPCLNFSVVAMWNSRLNKLAILSLGQDWAPFESGIADTLKLN